MKNNETAVITKRPTQTTALKISKLFLSYFESANAPKVGEQIAMRTFSMIEFIANKLEIRTVAEPISILSSQSVSSLSAMKSIAAAENSPPKPDDKALEVAVRNQALIYLSSKSFKCHT